ncbi:MAG TPA: hypothetical protein ENH75_05310 [archaeon]|nr:hypothetical protein [archaeon]
MRTYTYGPFQSRRLGLSLGINVLSAHKLCTYNCVYCEIGLTKKENLFSSEFRIRIPPTHKYRKELKSILTYFPHLNSITFGYNGEPTLNEHLLDFLNIAKEVRSELTWESKKPRLTLFTNSSTLQFDDIRDRVKEFELVLAKIDAGIDDDYKRTNRPHYNTSKVETLITSLIKLKQEMPPEHKLAIQCLVFNSYEKDFVANNNVQNIEEIAQALKRIKPDIVQVYSIARIPAEYFVYAISEERKKEIAKIFKSIVNDNNVDIKCY